MRALLTLVSTLALAACNQSAGAEEGQPRSAGARTERSFTVGDFQAVATGGAYDVVIKVGGAPSVRAEGDVQEIERMEVVVENGTLAIRRKRQSGSLQMSSRPVTVYVTAPSLRAASIGGAGDMRIDKVEGASFAGSIGGAGDMQIGSLRVQQASFSIGGSGNIRATGTANKSDISVAGSGSVELDGFKSRNASVSIVGSGDVRARATETADVSIVGSGDVTISGTAKCSVSKIGGGDVKCSA